MSTDSQGVRNVPITGLCALVCTNQSELANQITHVLKELGVPVVDSADAATPPDAVVQIGDALTGLSNETPSILLWARNVPPDRMPFQFSGLRHLLNITPTLDTHELSTTLRQIASGRLMTLDDLLDAPYLLEQAETTTSRQKSILIARFTQFLDGVGIRERQQHELINHLEELLTNAIFNAPVKDGHRPNAGLHRRNAAKSPRPVTLKWAFDRSRICVVVRDEFGSLDPGVVIDSFNRCFCGPKVAVQEKEGGAGLGLFTLLRFSSRLVINIVPGHSTEIFAVRRTDERRSPWPTLNICLRTSQS
ncbi:MAG: hypothetical protein V3T05_14355 [Myxococcota bacterium]